MVLAKFSSKIQLKSRFWQHCCSETTVFVGFYDGSNLLSEVS